MFVLQVWRWYAAVSAVYIKKKKQRLDFLSIWNWDELSTAAMKLSLPPTIWVHRPIPASSLHSILGVYMVSNSWRCALECLVKLSRQNTVFQGALSSVPIMSAPSLGRFTSSCTLAVLCCFCFDFCTTCSLWFAPATASSNVSLTPSDVVPPAAKTFRGTAICQISGDTKFQVFKWLRPQDRKSHFGLP